MDSLSRVSVSQVAREALEARLGWSGSGPRDLPFAAIGASADGRSIAADDEAYLRETWASRTSMSMRTLAVVDTSALVAAADGPSRCTGRASTSWAGRISTW